MYKNETLKKSFSFKATSFSESTENNEKYGIIEAYISAYGNVDSYGDVVQKGAFDKTIAAFKKAGKQIPLCWNHKTDVMIGGCPPEDVESDEKGLKVKAIVNLGFESGRTAYALAKQGALNSCSFAYSMDKFEKRKGGGYNITEVTLYEASFVPVPANNKANIVDVKGATTFANLDMAPRDQSWSKTEARDRVRSFTNSEDSPSSSYRRAFLWYDSDNADNFTAYKLPFADVVGGSLKAIFKALSTAAAALKGARGGVDIPAADKAKVTSHIGKYYKKMQDMGWDVTNPLEDDTGKFFDEFDCKSDIEEFLSDPFPLNEVEAKSFMKALNRIQEAEAAKESADDSTEPEDVSVKGEEKDAGSLDINKEYGDLLLFSELKNELIELNRSK